MRLELVGRQRALPAPRRRSGQESGFAPLESPATAGETAPARRGGRWGTIRPFGALIEGSLGLFWANCGWMLRLVTQHPADGAADLLGRQEHVAWKMAQFTRTLKLDSAIFHTRITPEPQGNEFGGSDRVRSVTAAVGLVLQAWFLGGVYGTSRGARARRSRDAQPALRAAPDRWPFCSSSCGRFSGSSLVPPAHRPRHREVRRLVAGDSGVHFGSADAGGSAGARIGRRGVASGCCSASSCRCGW